METFVNSLRGVLLGNTSGGELLGYMIWGIIGAAFYLMIKVRNRHKSKNEKPKRWSTLFFFWDNSARFLITIILVFIWSTWGHTISGYLPDEVHKAGGFIYLCIGFSTDLIVVSIIKIRKTVRERIMLFIHNKFGRSDDK